MKAGTMDDCRVGGCDDRDCLDGPMPRRWVESGYTIQKYISNIPNSIEPEGLAFSPDGFLRRPAELYVHDASPTRPDVSHTQRGTYALFASPSNASVGNGIPRGEQF